MNWAYAAAAAVAMIFGIILVNQGGEENTAVTETQALTANTPSVNTLTEPEVQNEATAYMRNFRKNDLTLLQQLIKMETKSNLQFLQKQRQAQKFRIRQIHQILKRR